MSNHKPIALPAPEESESITRETRQHAVKAEMPAYYKAGIVGCGLILLIVAVVGVAYLNVQTTTRTAQQIANQYQPALEHLLGTEYEIHQANVELSNYIGLPMSVGRAAYIAHFRERVANAQARFVEFQKTVPDLQDVNGSQKEYVTQVQTWKQLVETLIKNEGKVDPMQWGAQYGETTITYSNARAALLKIIDQDVGRRMNIASTKLISESYSARQMLIATLLAALLMGGAVTWAGVRAIRGQHLQILAEKGERERDAQRREFDHRLHVAFELVQSEPAAFSVVRNALVETLQPEQQGELLIADSSIAHLQRIVSTAPGGDRSGCGVTDPQECPAIRRNAQMNFANSSSFEACPVLRDHAKSACSAMCVPVSIMGRTAGVLHVVGPAGQLPSDAQRHSLGTLASSTGDELGLIRAFATKHQQANTDTLTGLANRRSLESRLPQLLARGHYSVAFIDIDRFKPLNDTYGHETGDRALRLFAEVLRHAVRPDDLAARWGGEEFVVMLPGTDVDSALPVIERIQDSLRDALSSGAVPTFTVSCGVSDSSRAQSFQSAIAQADEALLLAKRSGRNRVVVAMRDEQAMSALTSDAIETVLKGRATGV